MKRSKKDIFKYLLLTVGVFSISGLAFCDVANSDPVISSVFVRGSNLVYDCNGKNLVCASERSFSYCKEFNPHNKPCKLIKNFTEVSDCHDLQEELSSDNFSGEFCSN